jgi:hypothetical protein
MISELLITLKRPLKGENQIIRIAGYGSQGIILKLVGLLFSVIFGKKQGCYCCPD